MSYMEILGLQKFSRTSSVSIVLASVSFTINLIVFAAVKFWNVTTRIFILRVGRDNCDIACTSLAFLTSFDEPAGGEAGNNAVRQRPCRARILHVGGTLEKVEYRYKQLSEAWLESSQVKQ